MNNTMTEEMTKANGLLSDIGKLMTEILQVINEIDRIQLSETEEAEVTARLDKAFNGLLDYKSAADGFGIRFITEYKERREADKLARKLARKAAKA